MAFQQNRVRNIFLTLGALALGVVALYGLQAVGSDKLNGALALFAVWGIATVSLNLINGTLGVLSLGHHGFMMIGGYATALLILSEQARQTIITSGRSSMTEATLSLSVSNLLRTFGLDALTTPETLWVRFLIAIFIGGLLSAAVGFVVGLPALRLRGDYLAIVTFGFGEIIRLTASTRLFSPLTNGALGLQGVPLEFGKSVWWTFGILAVTVFVMAKLKYSSYGRAMEGIREDEIAAEAMGINLAGNKVLAFVLGAFFAGVAGGLWVSWLGGAKPEFFLFQLTFFFLVAISAGGTGSITGVMIGTALVVFVRQYGDPLEQAYTLSTWMIIIAVVLAIGALGTLLYRNIQRMRPRLHPSVYGIGGLAVAVLALGLIDPPFLDGTFRGFGLRAIFLSVVLIVIMIFRPSGVTGRAEFSWGWLLRERADEPTDEERAQDAWLTNPELTDRLEQAGAKQASAEASDDPAVQPLTETGEEPERDKLARELEPDDPDDAKRKED